MSEVALIRCEVCGYAPGKRKVRVVRSNRWVLPEDIVWERLDVKWYCPMCGAVND